MQAQVECTRSTLRDAASTTTWLWRVWRYFYDVNTSFICILQVACHRTPETGSQSILNIASYVFGAWSIDLTSINEALGKDSVWGEFSLSIPLPDKLELMKFLYVKFLCKYSTAESSPSSPRWRPTPVPELALSKFNGPPPSSLLVARWATSTVHFAQAIGFQIF